MTVDPLVLMTEVHQATQRLLRSAAALDDAAVAGPSLLPGWTRGHVLAHLARHADGCTNLLTGARTGQHVAQYASAAARTQDIEAGAGRPVAVHLADLRASAQRLAAAADAMSGEAWTVTVHPTTSGPRPAAALVWGRLREVEVHHVDLLVDYRPGDWSAAFSQHLLREVVRGFGQRPDAPAVLLRPTDDEHPLTVGGRTAEATVTGPSAELAAWLTGRDDGASLQVLPAGALPTVPRWM